MMVLRNDLICYDDDAGRIVRVLWLHPQSAGVAIIDVTDEKALPTIIRVDALIEDLQNGRARLLNPDPYVILASEASVPGKHKAVRDHAWELINGLVSQEPDIYLRNKRGKLLKSAMQANRITLRSLYRYLRRYWQRGQTPNALLPDYAKSGGKGKIREPKQAKRGRPRLYGSSPGINVDANLRRIFTVAIDRYYAEKGSRFTLDGAFKAMIRDFFCERIIDPESGLVSHRHKSEGEFAGTPTSNQFRYWYEKECDTLEIKRKRIGSKAYDKDMRDLLGTSAAETWGPGARYQIDATLADVYLVSRLKRDRIIGRPVLYVVIDVFSRMIVGIYIGLEGPSWVGAMMALANTVADKVAFCRQFGREIQPEDWPCHHLPASLLGDRGEIEGRYIETLANSYGVNVENTASFRADWKGVVEQRFRLLPAKFKPYVPGYIASDYRQRGGRDYRLDAVLDLDQFTRIIIDCVLHYNNHHEIRGYDKTQDMAADEVTPVPIDLWEWGIANRSGRLRTYPEELVRFSLLPVDQATVTEFGIRYKGCFYSCPEAVQQRWFDRARQGKRWPVPISYDPRGMDIIYLHAPDTPQGFIVCQLTDRSRADRGMSLWEIGQQQFVEKDNAANRISTQQVADADLAAQIEGTVAEALGMQMPSSNSDQSRTKDIRSNRAAEKQANRNTETFRFGDQPKVQQRTADIIPLRPENDYSEPDITEILGSLDDDGS
jgi:hypothetical protein